MATGIKLRNGVGGSTTLIINETQTTDEVVEISTTEITSGGSVTTGGAWTKYLDGTQTIYGTTTITPIADANTNKDVILTVPFVGVYVVVASIDSASSAVVSWRAIVKDATTITVGVTRTNTTDMRVHWHCMGRWK